MRVKITYRVAVIRHLLCCVLGAVSSALIIYVGMLGSQDIISVIGLLVLLYISKIFWDEFPDSARQYYAESFAGYEKECLNESQYKEL